MSQFDGQAFCIDSRRYSRFQSELAVLLRAVLLPGGIHQQLVRYAGGFETGLEKRAMVDRVFHQRPAGRHQRHGDKCRGIEITQRRGVVVKNGRDRGIVIRAARKISVQNGSHFQI